MERLNATNYKSVFLKLARVTVRWILFLFKSVSQLKMAVAIPGRHPREPEEDLSGPPPPLKFNKNKLFLRAMCEWCMKRSRKFRKRRILRKIHHERLVRKAKSFCKKINLGHFPPGWIEILEIEHGVLVKYPPRRLPIINNEESTSQSQELMSDENNNSAGSDNSDAHSHGSGSATTLSVTPEKLSEASSGGSDMENSNSDQSDEGSDIVTSPFGQNDDIRGIKTSTTVKSNRRSFNDLEILDSGQTDSSDGGNFHTNFTPTIFSTWSRSKGSPSCEIPICQWWLRCPIKRRILLTTGLDTDTDASTTTLTSDKINTYSNSTCSSKINTIYHGTSSSSAYSTVSPNSSKSSQKISGSSTSISSSSSSSDSSTGQSTSSSKCSKCS